VILVHDLMSIVFQSTAILQFVRTSKIQVVCPFKRTPVWCYSCRGHSRSLLSFLFCHSHGR